MKTRITIFLLVLALLLFGTMLNAQTATPPGAGDGSMGSPYQIATLDNLYWITQNSAEWGKYYIQTANINASTTSGWDGGAGFTPIGNGTTSFTGSFDGNGFEIDGLAINRSGTNYMGMFGYIDNPAVLDKIVLTNVSITGRDRSGGLVGRQIGALTIKNCSTTGSVTGRRQVGGLVGYITGSGTIEYCWSSASVTVSASGYMNGGLIGEVLVAGVTVRYCYATGNLTTVGSFNGGLVGYLPEGTIENSYSSSSISGSGNNTGGLVGKVEAAATVDNCYSVGNISYSGSTVGGLVGRNNGTITDSFWDTETSGKATSAGGTGKTTAEMKTEATFTGAGWNFTTIWQIIGTNYPDLRDNSNPALPVELISFTATKTADGVLLNWSTATEVNNYGFEVEAEVSGSWLNVGFVEGHGNSNSPKEYSYLDNSLATSYRLKQVDTDGGFEYSNVVTVDGNSVNKLSQNYPNPFNPSTQISYSIAKAQNVNISVYNALGQKVAELVNTKMNAGTHSVNFNGSNLASGLYFYKLATPNYTKTMKMLLLK